VEKKMKPYSWVGVHVEGDLLYYDEFPKELSDEQRRQLHLAELYHENDVRELQAKIAMLEAKLAEKG
jgi:hypothetical protein